MSHTPHELVDLFPLATQKIHDLKQSDTHFATLADRYHMLNRHIHRIDTGIEAASDDRTEALKKERLSLLDAVSAALDHAPPSAS
ncbi:MAG: hypothetical protein B7Y44_06325 [Sphingomonadales bacterium 28-55-16]|jgi:uncharacterized protein YdcH (DUF465 family)|nr:MAG: hypothetical protein B7Y44_06325 [Sphingomonadales bacterium 28-55-16]